MYTEWGGTFESLQSARLRLAIVVPICFVAIYALLYMALGSFVSAAIVFSAVPMALAGGVFALLLRGIPSRSPPRSGSLPCRASPSSTAS
jgi:cobalt-zinc-cadmium resistance protein CzcA